MSNRRLPIVLVLLALFVGAAAAGNRELRSAAGVQEPAVAALMPAANVRSSAWYCAGGPVTKTASADRITITNVGTVAVPAAVDVLVASSPIKERLVNVGARRSMTITVASLSRDPAAAIVVQPLGAGIVVAQGFSVNGDIAAIPCATRTASDWYFASGTSTSATQMSLSLLNPYQVDTVVDVDAFSENGLRVPSTLQGLVVRAHSRLVVRIDQAVAQQKIVALAVRSRNDQRISATQSVVHAHASSSDASLSLGALAPARTWMFADDRSRQSSVQQLVLANTGNTDANVRVSLVSDLSTLIQPRAVKVPPATAVAVDLSRAVPAGGTYTLVVSSPVPVVAETRITYTAGSGLAGLVTETGTTTAMPRWWFAGGPFSASGLGAGGPRVPDGYDLAVVMAVGATDAQIAEVRHAVQQDGHVESFKAVARKDALAAFLAANRDNPALVTGMNESKVAASFAVKAKSASFISLLRRRLAAHSGVAQVLLATGQKPPVTDAVVVFNPGPRVVRVTLVALANGTELRVPGMSGITIAPNRQATVSLLAVSQPAAAVRVTASGPVVAERFIALPTGTTRAPGVPGS